MLLLTLPENKCKHTCPPDAHGHQRAVFACYQCVKRVATSHALSSLPEQSLYVLSALNHYCRVHLKHSLMIRRRSLQIHKWKSSYSVAPESEVANNQDPQIRNIPAHDANTAMCFCPQHRRLWGWGLAVWRSVFKKKDVHSERPPC